MIKVYKKQLNQNIILLSLLVVVSLTSSNVFADTEKEIMELEASTMEMIEESNYDQALDYTNQILKLDPDNINALNNKGGILIKLGNNSAAIDNFDTILEIDVNNTQALNNKAIALTNLENYEEALRTFYRSLVSDPSNQNTRNNIDNLVENVYWVDEKKNGYAVLTIHDKNGNLISYSRISEIKVQPPLGYLFFEKFGTVKEVDIDGETVKVIEYTGSVPLERTQFVGRADLFLQVNDYTIKVVEMVLNGFIATPSDKIVYDIVIFDPQF